MTRHFCLSKECGHKCIVVILAPLALALGVVLLPADIKAKKTDAPPIDPTAYVSLVSNRVTSVAHLLNWFAEQQDHFERLIPPGIEVLTQPGTPDVLVIDLDSKDLSPEFAKHLLGTTPVFRYSVPTYDIFVQETAEGTIEVRDSDGNVLYADPAPSGYAIPYEALYRQSQYPHHYIPELARYRLNARVTLLPLAYVEHYLFAKQQIEEAASLFEEEEPPLMMMMSGSGDDVWISAMTRMTNGLRLSLDYTESYSGQVWSAYSYDARYCPITNSVGGSGGGSPPVPGTNDPPACTNCPISDCDIDVTNSFLGLERVWSLTYSNLLLTGATRTVWLDTRPMGLDAQTNPTHRFYGFGSNVDTDGDGLNDGHELFISHTDRENADTDGDGLPDGWEVQNGLNPLSSAGADGASGDPDGDGLSNAEELQAQTNPRQVNRVIDLDASQVVFESRHYEVNRAKCGDQGFTNANKRYLRFEAVRNVYTHNFCSYLEGEGIEEAFDVRVYDPVSCVVTQSGYTDIVVYEYDSLGQCTSRMLWLDEWSGHDLDFSYFAGGACDMPPDYFANWDFCAPSDMISLEPAATIHSDTQASYSNLVGFGFCSNNYIRNVAEWQLDDEYTTEMLITNAWSDLNLMGCGGWTTISWGVRSVANMMGVSCHSNAVLYCESFSWTQLSAVRDLSSTELSVMLRKVQFRLKTLDYTQAVYRAKWSEVFYPEGGGSNQVMAVRSVVFAGTGSGQYIVSTNMVIRPPQEDGHIIPEILSIGLALHAPKVLSDTEAIVPATNQLLIGGVTVVNLDNDDDDGFFDYDGAGNHDVAVAGGDNELVKVVLRLQTNGLPNGTVRLTAPLGASHIAVWATNTKATASAYSLGTALQIPQDFAVSNGNWIKPLWIEGLSAHTTQRATRLRMEYTAGTTTISDDAALTILGVTGVTWKGRSNSVSDADTLDSDTNWPSGLLPNSWRVFPDARYTTNGVEPNARDRVTVNVGLSAPPPQPVTFYLRSFDVDDPTAATNAVDNESTDDDNRGTTPAQAGQFTGQNNGLLALTFPANVRETNAEFQVTMQPGDNFRVAVNADSNFLLRLENRDTTQHVGSTEAVMNANKQRICHPNVTGTPADRELRLSTNYASDVLTVWRFLHVEVDSMAAVTNNEVTGSITAIHGAGSSATNLVLNVNLRTGLTPNDQSANLSSGNDNGRFENGRIEIGADRVVSANIMGNGDDFVLDPQGFDIPAEITSGGATTTVGQVVAMAGQTFTVSSSMGTNSYTGATLRVAGSSFSITTNGATTITVSGTPTIPFVLWDDDSGSRLPQIPNTSDVDRAFRPAFILSKTVLQNTNATTPFVQNVDTATNLSQYAGVVQNSFRFDNVANSSNSSHWVVYLSSAFQSACIHDGDHDSEGAVLGTVDDLGGVGALIFLESLAETPATTTVDEKYTVTHELGHLFGGSHDFIHGFDGGLMDQSSVRTSVDFTPVTLHKIRTVNHP